MALRKLSAATNGVVMISYFGKWNSTMNVEVLDVTGQVVMRTQVTEYSYALDLGNLASGVYTLRFTGEGGAATRKIVRQ